MEVKRPAPLSISISLFASTSLPMTLHVSLLLGWSNGLSVSRSVYHNEGPEVKIPCTIGALV